MRKLLFNNPVLSDTEKTWLTSTYSSGVALSVINTFAYAANDLAVVGELAEEKSELKKIDSITSNTALALASALKFTHPKDTPIYKTPWDFISIEGRSSSAGVFAEISLSGIQWDKKQTVYFHSSGDNNWQYRFRFNNSVSATYSEYSPTISGSGFTKGLVGYMIRQIRKIVNDNDRQIIQDVEIIRFLNAAQDIIAGIRQDWWFLRAENSSVTTVAGTRKYTLPSAIGTLGVVEGIRANYEDTSDTRYNIKYKSPLEFDYLTRDRGSTAQDDYVQYYTLLEPDGSSDPGYFEIWPEPKTTGKVTFFIRYTKTMDTLDTVDNETPIPIPQILENYAIGQIERIKGNDEKAAIYEALFWGPPPGLEINRQLTGIALLENLNNAQKKPSGQPRQLIRFRGQKPMRTLYGDKFVSTTDARKDYF